MDGAPSSAETSCVLEEKLSDDLLQITLETLGTRGARAPAPRAHPRRYYHP